MKENGYPIEASVDAQDQDIVRIQAAAVVAQQAALDEEEARLQQRRLILEQQEAQLAAHLEEKGRRLADLRDQARQARLALAEERTAFEASVARRERKLAQTEAEVRDGEKDVQAERRRLLKLARKMKHRWHRNWMEQKAQVRLQESTLAAQKLQLDQERGSFQQARLSFNGDMELGRRQLRDAWDELKREQKDHQCQIRLAQQDLDQRARDLEQGRSEILGRENQLTDDKNHWFKTRHDLEKEVAGLHNRIHNLRQNLIEQRNQKPPLDNPPDAVLMDSQSESALQGGTPEVVDGRVGQHHYAITPVDDAERATQVIHLESLAGDLADQRAHLAEQFQELALLLATWQKDRAGAVDDLETLALELREREESLRARQEETEAAAFQVRKDHEELTHMWRYLEGWQARLNARQAAWEHERDRLLAQVKGREVHAEKEFAILADARSEWDERRRLDLEQFKVTLEFGEKLKKECLDLREQWLERRGVLEQKQRALTEQSLIMRQYWQDRIVNGASPEDAEDRSRSLRDRLNQLGEAAERVLARERGAVLEELSRLNERYTQLQEMADLVAARQVELSRRDMAWQKEQADTKIKLLGLQQQVILLQEEKNLRERLLGEKHQEVERLIKLFMDEGQPPALPMARAA